MKSAFDTFCDNAGKFDILPPATIIKLSRVVSQWINHQDTCSELTKIKGRAARDKMIRHNMKLIVHIWKKRFYVRLPQGHPGLLDAFQTAAIGLTRAAELFKPGKGCTFSTYATIWISKGFNDYLSNEDRMIRIPANNLHMIRVAESILHKAEREGQPRPTTKQLLELMAVDGKGRVRKNLPRPAVLEEWLEQSANTRPKELDRVQSARDNSAAGTRTLGDTIASASKEDLERDLVSQQIGYLSDTEQLVLRRRYFDAHISTYSEIGKELGYSKAYAIDVHKRAVASLQQLTR